MRFFKQVVILMSVLLISTAFFITVSSSNVPTITVSENESKAGDSVDIKIDISNNPGIISMLLSVSYDSRYLTLKKITNGSVLNGAMHNIGALTANPYTLNWADDIATENNTSNGTIVTLSFAISTNAPGGKLPITVTYDNNNAAIYDMDMELVDFAVINGGIEILSEKTYTITYNSNGGSGAPASQTKIHGENLTLSTVKPVRDGYTFKGWATSSSGSVAYGRGAVYKADSSVTLYAVWEKEAVSVSGISLNRISATLTAGESLALTATVTPSNATNKNVVWTSSDTSVATVTSSGVVTANSAGTATITAKTSDGGKTATCVITVNKAYDTNALTFSISSAKVLPGKTLKINLNISNNKGFAGAKFVIWYDNSVMTLKGYETNWPGNCESKFNDDASYVPVAFVFGRTTDWKANQTLLTLEFKIKEDAPLGEYDLVFTADRNVSNERRQNVDANFVGGKIEIVDSTPGDVNGDGYINTKDAVLLAQHLAEWEVDVDLVGADCNRDGNIDTKDAVLLAQYLAEWKVTLG